jgi:hypothetical protein
MAVSNAAAATPAGRSDFNVFRMTVRPVYKPNAAISESVPPSVRLANMK